jgi:hypothetical protein
MTYEIMLTVPDTDPITETGETADPISFLKQRLPRFLVLHPELRTPGSTLTLRFEQPAE